MRAAAAMLTALASALLVLAVHTGPVAVVSVTVGVQLLLASGVAAQERAGSVAWAVVVGAGAGASFLAVHPAEAQLGVLAPAAGGAIVATLAFEVLRGHRRQAVTSALATTATAGLLGVLAAAWVVSAKLPEGLAVVTSGAVGVGLAGLVWALPVPRGLAGPVAPVLAAAGGWLVGGLLDPTYAPAAAAAVAAAGSLGAVVGLTLTGWWSPTAREHALLVATVPVALAAPLVHIAARFAAAWS